jgi:hypothetical protein
MPPFSRTLVTRLGLVVLALLAAPGCITFDATDPRVDGGGGSVADSGSNVRDSGQQPPPDARVPDPPDAMPEQPDAMPDPPDSGFCGRLGEPCCQEGPACLEGRFVECFGGTCEECGDLDQQCCLDGPPCRGLLTCFGDRCTVL